MGGSALLDWLRATRTFHRLTGEEGGSVGVDDDFTARSFENVGAWIMGRNMFGPVRGPWLNEDWKGWWGDAPVFHTSVFVLTHHPRASLAMAGGTTFYFVTEGIQAALRGASEAANGKDIRIGGGAATVRQFLSAGLVDELHLAIAPALLGSGEPLLADADMLTRGYRVTKHVCSPQAMHVVLSRVWRRRKTGVWIGSRRGEENAAVRSGVCRRSANDRESVHSAGAAVRFFAR